MNKLWRRLAFLLFRRRFDGDLEEEMRFHLEMKARASGGTDDARYAAKRQFGNAFLLRETSRELWGWVWFEELAQDLHYAIRMLRRSPGFTTIAVLSLALGIGANTAIFTFVNAALLKPLPYPHPDRIVALSERHPKHGIALVHPRSFIEWHDRARSFEALAIAQAIPVNTEGDDGPEQVAGLWTTSELFQVFGVWPSRGRAFTDQETRPDASSVVILSHGYWQRRFGSDPNILGKTIQMERESSTVIGVMPAGFRVGTLNTDVYLPLPLDHNKPESVGSRSFQCYGRLRPDVSLALAQAEMAVIADQAGRQYAIDEGWGVVLVNLRDYLAQDSRQVLLLLLGVVAFVLLIACANIASLLLTRGVGRRSELALRASLGAGRLRLIQQLLIESLVLSAVGGVLGLVLGFWASRALVLLANDAVAFGQMADARLDIRVLGFTLALSLLTAIVFGLAPAWQASRFDLQGALKEHGRGSGDTRGQQRFRSALVVGEVALAVVLLVGAGLLLRTFSQLLQVKLGFQPEHVLTMHMVVTGGAARRANLVEGILDRVEALPEVRAVGTIQFLPLGGWTNRGPLHFVGRPAPAAPESMESDTSVVSHGYFAAMGIPVLRGRPFGRQDRMGSRRVALVNQSFVNRYCRQEDPLGLRISGDWSDPAPAEIVGVVGDIRHDGLTLEPRPTVFLAQAQGPGYITYLVVRTTAAPEGLARAIRHEILQVDHNQPVTDLKMMDEYVSASLARPKLYAALIGAFACLALVLAAVGLYGLMAYAVSRRTHEIGIRIALGAQPQAVLRSILVQGARLALMGLALGVVCAILASRFVASLLYGVSPGDVPTYAGVAALLGAVALIAAYVPARRASRVDPMVALHYE